MNKKSIKKRKKIYQQESILKKNVGPGIVMICISWLGHPGYQKKLDMEINRGAFKRARTPRLLKKKQKRIYK